MTGFSSVLARVLASDKFRYLVVGGSGFAYELVAIPVLGALAGVGPEAARFFTFPTAIVLTWLLNRVWTFRSKDDQRVREFTRYLVVQVSAGVVNLAVYWAVLAVRTFEAPFAAPIALACGSALGLVVSYIGSRVFAFRGTQ